MHLYHVWLVSKSKCTIFFPHRHLDGNHKLIQRREVNYIVCSRFVNIFSHLESLVFDTTNEVHLFALHLVYIPLINEALQELSEAWNCHSLSTEGNLSPRQLWVQGMLTSQNTNYSAVASVQDNEEINWNEYGIDEDGPVADLYF